MVNNIPHTSVQSSRGYCLFFRIVDILDGAYTGVDGWGSLTFLVEISVQVVRVKVLELLQLPMV